MNVLERIETNFIHFSPKEKLLATYILQEGRHFKNINIQEMSKLTGVSPATITRFCRKINCESFVDLKLQLQAIGTTESVEPANYMSDIFTTVSQFYYRVIHRTSALLSVKQLHQLIDKLMQANRIVLYGMGSSGLTARELAIRLLRMGLNATSETDAHMMIIGSTVTQPGDIVIGISNSGETKEVVNALKNAKRNGATLVAMTSIKGSTLAKLATDTIIVHNSRFVNNEQFVNTQLPMFFLVDIVTLLLLENSEYSRNMKKTIQEITTINQLL